MHALSDAIDPRRSNWDDFRILLAVLRAGSLTRAARTLGVEQSTVTRRIRALEQSLGHSLFERRYDGLSPTALCRELVDYAERMEGAALGMLAVATHQDREPEGRVRLATTGSFAVHVLLPHVLAPLRAKHPRIAIDLVLDDRVTDLARHEADLALRFTRPARGDLIAKRLAVMPTAVVAHRDYAGAQGVNKKRADALDWVVHALPGESSTNYQMHFSDVAPKLTCTNHLAVVEAVRAGLGVSVLATALCELFPELVRVPVKLQTPALELWLVTARAAREVPRIDAVWSFLESHLGPVVGGRSAPRQSRRRAP